MKKLFVLLMIFCFTMQSAHASYASRQLKATKHAEKYNSVKIHTRNFHNKIPNKTIKDPKLIKLSEYKIVSDTDYTAKLKKDENLYKTQIMPALKEGKQYITVNQPYVVDMYDLYKITEKIVRANNLGYINWRVLLYNDTKNFQSYTSSVDLIAIYSALYDSLYGNDDALAFVISHELSHQILGHPKRFADIYRNLKKFSSSSSDNTVDALYYYKKMRDMEYEADAQAFELLKRAGYSEEKAMDAMNFMDALPDMQAYVTSHPRTKDRIKNAVVAIEYIAPTWADEGKYNIYTSNVIPCKRSSDKKSFILVGSKSDKIYQMETYDQRLLRYAYVSYIKGNNKDAIKYFNKLVKSKPKYEYYLYLSYAYENMYNSKNSESILKKALEAANTSLKLSKNNKYANEQVALIESMMSKYEKL